MPSMSTPHSPFDPQSFSTAERSPAADVVRLREGILGVDVVHKIAKTYLGGGADVSGSEEAAEGQGPTGVAMVRQMEGRIPYSGGARWGRGGQGVFSSVSLVTI